MAPFLGSLLLAGGSVLAGPPAETPPPAEAAAAVQACLETLPQGVQLSCALVNGDTVTFLGAERTAEGVRRLDNRRAVFQIGSITKVFTATLLAQEAVKGTLSLEDPVQRFLPFKLKASARDGAEITLGQLASHTSGIKHHQPPGLMSHAFFHGHSEEPWKDYDPARFEAYLREDLALGTRPGTAYFYSNMGMSLVGRVLELKAGKGYETLLQERLFAPLGMTGSSTDHARVSDHLVVGRDAKGKPMPGQAMGALAPCGGILTCAEDLARFAKAQFEPADPALALTQRPVFTLEPGYWVALGWHGVDRAEGWRWLNHNGGIGGYTSSVNIDPRRGRAVVVLASVTNDEVPGERVRALARRLMKDLEGYP